jgi:nicotinamidase-related amidase
MPLLERADCLLVIVDAQPGFVAHPSMSATEHEQSAAALGHAAWLAGLARLLDVPAVVVEEGVERNDATDETLRARLPPSTPVIGKTTFSLVA